MNEYPVEVLVRHKAMLHQLLKFDASKEMQNELFKKINDVDIAVDILLQPKEK